MIGDKALSTQATENEKNQGASASASSSSNGSSSGGSGGVDRSIKNLSTTAKLAKFKKPKMTNFRTEFLTSEVKKAFTYLQKAVAKALILYHFDPERHIYIKTDTLGYAIGEVLS